MTTPGLDALLARTQAAMTATPAVPAGAPLRVGVDLGTAFTVVIVTDDEGEPVAGAYEFADVVRDGVVWDFAGATVLVTRLVKDVEGRLGRELATAAVTIPPGVDPSNHRAHRYVVEGAGLECSAVVDETTAANAVLRIRDGAVVDIGGGTTGIAVLRDGRIVASADEPTGGTHLSLVLAGALKIPFGEAELLKRDPANHARLFPLVRPVMEKMATIVARAVSGHDVDHITLVGGTSAFAGIAGVVESVTGIATSVPGDPLFVTPLGVASFDTAATTWSTDSGG